MSGEEKMMNVYTSDTINVVLHSQNHHNLSGVGEVEIADPIVPQKFSNLHQTVTLL